MVNQDPKKYRIADQADADDVIRLLATVFSESEPPAVAMGLSFREMEEFLGLFAPGAIELGLTMVARGTSGRKLAGVVLTDDFGRPPGVNPDRISAKFRPIFAMLESLDKQFRREKTIPAGEYLHLFMLGVAPEFAGRGIAQGLVAACLKNGIGAGYRAAVTEATGKISQSVFRKLGFVERFRVCYRDFRYEGREVFRSIDEHEAAILMEKSLSAIAGPAEG
jgi:ribosomal protein S18 acetylase RimI-like enzyme